MNRDTWVPFVGGVIGAVFLWLFLIVGYALAETLATWGW
jgi:hypothetical protein